MLEYREGSAIYSSKIGAADKPNALSYWLRVNLRELVELYIKVSVIG